MIRALTAVAFALSFNFSALSITSGESSRYWNALRGYAPFTYATPSGVEINNATSLPISDSCRLSKASDSFTLTFRMTNHAFRSIGKPGTRPCGFFLTAKDGEKVWLTVETEEKSDLISSSSLTKLSLYKDGAPAPLASSSTGEGISPYGEGNIWKITVNDGKISVAAGRHALTELIAAPLGEKKYSSFGFTVSPGGKISVADISFEPLSYAGIAAPGKWADTAMLREYLLSSSDPMEGYWTVFDRSLDESLLRLGGDYRLAIVKDGVNYLLLYLGGASVNASSWLPGMTKAILRPDSFPGIYNLEWIDSQGLPLNHQIKAQSGEENTLSLQFPYQDSSIRLRKIPFPGK